MVGGTTPRDVLERSNRGMPSVPVTKPRRFIIVMVSQCGSARSLEAGTCLNCFSSISTAAWRKALSPISLTHAAAVFELATKRMMSVESPPVEM